MVLIAVGIAGTVVAAAGSVVALRRRRPFVTAAAAVLLVGSAGAAVVGGLADAGRLNLAPREPVWSLRRDLGGPPSARSAASAELTDRMAAGRLSADQASAVADRALAAQADGAVPWDPAWGQLVEAAHAAGLISPAQWGTYARQAIVVSIGAPPTVAPGQVLSLSPNFAVDRCVAAGFAGLFDCVDLQIDGRAVALESGSERPGRHAGMMAVGNTPNQIGGTVPAADEAATAALPAGPHVATVTVRVFLYEPADLARADVFSGTQPDPAKQLATFDLHASAPFATTKTPPAPLALAVEPSRRAAVADAIRVTHVAVRGGFTSVAVRFAPPPVPFRFAVQLRPAGGGPAVNLGTVSCGAGAPGWANLTSSEPLGPGVRVDAVFRPDPDGTVTGVDGQPVIDPAPIWGEDVIIPGVLVDRP